MIRSARDGDGSGKVVVGKEDSTDSAGTGDRRTDTATAALVLGGGGARGAYQVGVLSAIAERAPAGFGFGVLTGVSAGAINAACLAGCSGTLADAAARLRSAWRGLTIERVFRTGFTSLTGSGLRWLWMLATGGTTPGFDVRGLLDTAPLRDYLRGAIDLDGIARTIDSGRLRALALSATQYSTGRTVTFVDGADGLEMWERAGRRAVRTRIGLDHVMASSALPLIFPAIEVDGDWYGDGSIRQHAPLAPAIHLGADRLLAISVRYPRSQAEAAERLVRGYPPPAQVLGMLMNAVFLDALEMDGERIHQVNEMLARMGIGTAAPGGLRPVRLLVVAPSRDLGKLASDLGSQLPRSLRYVLRGLGAQGLPSPDFLSYLLFERPYIDRLIDLGYDDAAAGWPGIERFLTGGGDPRVWTT